MRAVLATSASSNKGYNSQNEHKAKRCSDKKSVIDRLHKVWNKMPTGPEMFLHAQLLLTPSFNSGGFPAIVYYLYNASS